MNIPRQVSIKMEVDSTSVTSGTVQAGREFERFGNQAKFSADQATRSLAQVNLSVTSMVRNVAGLAVVATAVHGITSAIASVPRDAFNFSKNLEVSQVGMAGILGSMTAINGQQTQYNAALAISRDYIRKLNDDALRTAASSAELVNTFQAIMAPGLAAGMTLEQIRKLAVVGTNAVKAIGLDARQIVQEIRDLVGGGITAASSTLATALGLKDSDIAKAKASSEGLFNFLIQRMQGFEAASQAFGDTLQGRLDQMREGATRVAAAGMEPLTLAIKRAISETTALFGTFEAGKEVGLNPQLVQGVTRYAEGAAGALEATRNLVSGLWEHREAIGAVATVYTTLKISRWLTDVVAMAKAQYDVAQASRLAAVQAAAETTANTQSALSSRQKVAAYLGELEALRLLAVGKAQDAAASVAQLSATAEGITVARADVVAKLSATRAAMAQAEAQLAAARSAGALSFALALTREATQSLAAAQTRQALLVTELAVLGRQQASVQAALTAATVAQTAATNGATAATASLTAATGAASVGARGLGIAAAALGGPVGIGVLAVSGLALWLYKLKSGADEARDALHKVSRAQADLAAGRSVQDRDLNALRMQLEKARADVDEIEQRKTANPTANARKAVALAAAQTEVSKYEELISRAQERASQGTEGLTLTLSGSHQAWQKVIGDAKTASAAQEEYRQNLDASRRAFGVYKEALVKSGASADVIADAQKKQDEAERAFAQQRDKKLKEMGAASQAARDKLIDAQVEAVKRGYRLEQLTIADGIDAVDSLRKQDLISEQTAVERKRDLKIQEIDAHANAVRAELAEVKTRKDSAKEQAALNGQLQELAQQRVNVANKAARDITEIYATPQIELVRNTRQATQAIHDQVVAQEAQNAAFGKGKHELIQFTIAQLDKSIADLEATENVVPGYIKVLRELRAEQIKLRDAVAFGEGQEATKRIVEEQKRAADQTLQIWKQKAGEITDALMGGFSSVKAWVKREFANLVIRPHVSPIAGTITNALGYPGGGVAGAVSGISGLSNAGSMVSGASGIAGMAGSFGSGVATGFNSLISGGSFAGALATGGTAAAGSAAAIAAGNAASASALAAGATAAEAAAAAGSAAATATTASGTLGAALGYLGPVVAVVALLAALGQKFKGETRSGAQYGYGFDGFATNDRNGTRVAGDGVVFLEGPSGGEIAGAQVRAAINGTVSGINATLKAVGSNASLTGFQAGLETSDKGRGGVFSGGTLSTGAMFGESGKGDNYLGTLYESTSARDLNGEQALQNFSTDLLQVTIQALQAATDIPESVAKKLRGVDAEALSTDAAQALVGSINTQIAGVEGFRTAVLTLPFADLKALSFDATSQLLDMVGGLEQWTAKVGSFYQLYFTEEERAAQARTNVTDFMSNLGYASINTTDQFRQLVTGLDKTTTEGSTLYAALLNIAPAFHEVYGAVTNTLNRLNAAAKEHFAALDARSMEGSLATDATSGIDKFLGTVAQSADSLAKAQISTAQAAIQAARDAASQWRAAQGTIESAIESIRNEGLQLATPQASYAYAKAFLSQQTAAALGGDANAASAVADASKAFIEASASKSIDRIEYLRDRAIAQAQLTTVLDKTKAQVTVQEAIAAAGEKTVAQLEALNVNLSGFAGQVYELLSKGYAGADRETATEAAGKLAKATSDFAYWFSTMAEGDVTTGGQWGSGKWTRLAGDMAAYIGANGDTTYLRATDTILDVAKKNPELRAIWENQYGFKLPSYRVGTAFLPTDGPVMAHRGEKIIDPTSSAILNKYGIQVHGSGDDGATLLELRAIRKALQDSEKDRDAMKKDLLSVRETLDLWMRYALPVRTFDDQVVRTQAV